MKIFFSTFIFFLAANFLQAQTPPLVSVPTDSTSSLDCVFYDEEPNPLNLSEFRDSISCPKSLSDAGITGKVVVKILVSETGETQEYKVIRDTHPLLTKAVTSRVYMLKWSPGKINGKPVKYWVTMPIDIHLNK